MYLRKEESTCTQRGKLGTQRGRGPRQAGKGAGLSGAGGEGKAEKAARVGVWAGRGRQKLAVDRLRAPSWSGTSLMAGGQRPTSQGQEDPVKPRRAPTQTDPAEEENGRA